MWIVNIVCSDSHCAKQWEVIVSDLDELERIACDCGHSGVTLTVASVEPVLVAAA